MHNKWAFCVWLFCSLYIRQPMIYIVDHGVTLRWRHNGHDSDSNHQPRDCLLNRLFRSRSKKTSKLRVTSLCVGNSPGTGEFPAQMASNAENVSIWWRHHDIFGICITHQMLKPEYARITWSISCLLMNRILVSPGHQQHGIDYLG